MSGRPGRPDRPDRRRKKYVESEDSDDTEYDNDTEYDTEYDLEYDSEYDLEYDSNESNTSSDETDTSCEIIYECDGMAITNLSKYWIHIITEEQWNIILKNIDRKLMYLSAYSFTSIKAGDIILIYQKSQGPTKPGGFVSIAEVSMDMIENDGTLDSDNRRNPSGLIRVYRDQNMNRYVMRICTMSIFHAPIKHSFLKEIIGSTSTNFRSLRQFVMSVFTGDCRFQMLDSEEFGLETVKYLIQESQNQLTELSDSDDDSNDSNNSDNPNAESTTLDPATQTDPEFEARFEQRITPNTTSETLSSTTPDSDVTAHLINTEFTIEKNIPILLVPCSELPKQIKKLEKHKNKVLMIYQHYTNCAECDVTNNNGRELGDSIRSVGLHNIKFMDSDHTDPLLSYLIDEPYPQPKSNNLENVEQVELDNNDNNDDDEKLEHHITFYQIRGDPIYAECILIDFTSRVQRLMTADEGLDTAIQIKKTKKDEKIKKKAIKSEPSKIRAQRPGTKAKSKSRPKSVRTAPRVLKEPKYISEVTDTETETKTETETENETETEIETSTTTESNYRRSNRIFSKSRSVKRPNIHKRVERATDSDKRKDVRNDGKNRHNRVSKVKRPRR